MKPLTKVLATAALLFAATGAFAQTVDPGIPVVNNDKMELNITGRGQMMGTGEFVPDAIADNARVYLFMNEARLGVKGRFEDWFRYEMNMDFGGESINGSNTNMSLLDMVADIPVKPLGEGTIVKIGQFRVPYSREGLTDTGYMDFTNKSVANMASYWGRDYGLAVETTKGNLTGTIGTFTGGGRNVPQRYLPEQIGIPFLVARVGYNDGIDQDIYHVVGVDRDIKRDGKAFYVNGLFMTDTRIGHSTALGVHTIDDNLLIDSNFNPYLKQTTDGKVCSAGSCQRGSVFFLGADGVIRHRIDDTSAVELEVEGNWGGYQNHTGVMHIASGRVQTDYQKGAFDIGLRYGILSMDDNAGFLDAPTTAGAFNPAYSHETNTAGKGTFQYNAHMGEAIHEITPSMTWHFRGHNMKVVASLPIFINAPLWLDNADGVYAFPDPTPSGAATLYTSQGSVLKTPGNTTRRAIVPEGRMMFQFMF